MVGELNLLCLVLVPTPPRRRLSICSVLFSEEADGPRGPEGVMSRVEAAPDCTRGTDNLPSVFPLDLWILW